MQKWIMILLGVVAIGLAGWLVAKGFAPPAAVGPPIEAGTSADGAVAASAEAGADGALTATVEDDAGTVEGTDASTSAYAKMPDGTPVPPLPQGTPNVVRFGVVLVQYQGAQAAKADARTKVAAKELADTLAQTAQTDFSGAVKKGDPGSQEDVGHIKRGMLEPVSEYFLFSLQKGGVSAAFDTPRGYWIVKRID